MGLFDFLKRKNTEPESFETIFEKSATDAAYRSLFYRRLLKSGLYILTNGSNDLPKGRFISDKNTRIQVRTFSNDVVPVFTSIEKIFDNNVITGQVPYVVMEAIVIFEMFKNERTFIINPYSKISKEMLPEEIKQLLNNEFFQKNEEQIIKVGEIISLGKPANYPINLTETLKRYFEIRKEIKSAYLALKHVPSNDEKPNLLLGLEIINGNKKEIFEEIAEMIKPYLINNEPFDLMDLSENDETSKYLKTNQFQIYNRK